MNPVLKDAFIDMLFQGSMRTYLVKYFESNDADDVIAMIQKRPVLMMYESNRNRINYLQGNKK